MRIYKHRAPAAAPLIVATLAFAVLPKPAPAQMPPVLGLGCSDHTIHLWDASGKPLQDFLAHDGAITCLAFSPDGKRIYSGSVDKTVKVWNTDDGSLENSLDAHDKPVYCLALSPNGKVLATGGGDNQVKLWNAMTGKPLRAIPAHSQAVRAIAWSPDGQFFASGGADRLIQIWRADGNLLGTIVAHDEPINSLAWTRDSRFVISASADGYLKVWSVADLSLIYRHRAHERGIVAMALSPDGRMVATSGGDSRIRIWTVGPRSLTELVTLSLTLTPDRSPAALGWTRDSAILITGGADRMMRFLNARDLSENRKSVTVDSAVTVIAMIPA